MIINKNKVALLASVSKNIGLGHIKRLYNLSKHLKKCKKVWIIQGNKNLASTIINKKKIYQFNKFDYSVINFLNKIGVKKIIMDISHDEYSNKYILKIQKIFKINKFKIISFDRPNQNIISDISIMPYNFKSKIKKNKYSRIFKGQEYHIDHIRKKKIHSKKFIKKILIIISGTDPYKITYKLYNCIKKLNYKFIIISKVYEKPIRKILNKNKDKLIKFCKNINKIFEKVDGIICGEGLIKYEAVKSFKPTVIIHQKDNSSEMIKNFKKQELCLSLGKINKFDKKIKKKIEKYFNDKKLINIHLKNSYNAFFSKKILEEQKKLIKEINLL